MPPGYKKISQLPQDTNPSLTSKVPLVDGGITDFSVLSDLIAFIFSNIPAGAHSDVTRGSETITNFVASGLVWTADSVGVNRNASMTSGVIYINGRRITISAVTARTFPASKDSYIDVLDNLDGTGTVVYTPVANGATTGFTLAANSVRIAEIITGATTIASTASIIRFGSDILGNIFSPIGASSATKLQNPAKFRAHQVAAQNTTGGSFTKVLLDTEDYDTGANFDITTNHRFVAPIAGYYSFNGHIATVNPGTFFTISLYKNGTEYKRGVQLVSAANACDVEVSDVIQLAVNDFIELYVLTTSTVAITVAGAEQPTLTGFLVSAT